MSDTLSAVTRRGWLAAAGAVALAQDARGRSGEERPHRARIHCQGAQL